jgi:hypothetical protein
MFTRFRATPSRLQVGLIETRRTAGRVRHEHVAALGSAELPLPGVEKRRKVGDRAALIDQLWSAIEAIGRRGNGGFRRFSPTPGRPGEVG